MKMKRAVLMAVMAIAIAALALPIVGLRARASSSSASAKSSAPITSLNAARAVAATPSVQQMIGGEARQIPTREADQGVLSGMGLRKANGNIQDMIAKKLSRKSSGREAGRATPQSGNPIVLNPNSAGSTSLITNLGGRDTQFSEVTLLADWDGREDCAADRERKVDDTSELEPENDYTMTRSAISAHTYANGFNETAYYYGDSVGNLFVAHDYFLPDGGGPINDGVFAINIPDLVGNLAQGNEPGVTINVPTGQAVDVPLLNPSFININTLNDLQGALFDCTDDQVVVTGIAVQPVADLGDFGLCNTVGEVVYVSILDTEGCQSRTIDGQIYRTRIFAIAFADVPGTGVVPIAARQILRSPLWNLAGVAVDDDGSLYFQLIDLGVTTNGGAIFVARETCGANITPVAGSFPATGFGGFGAATADIFVDPDASTTDTDGNPFFVLPTGCGATVPPLTAGTSATSRVNRVIPYIPGGDVSPVPFGSIVAGAVGCGASFDATDPEEYLRRRLSLATNVAVTENGDAVTGTGCFGAERVRTTNYSGTSTTFGNIVAMDAGPCNVLYAAVSGSSGATGADGDVTGRFRAPSAFANGLPSMIISFADCGGAFDPCTGVAGALAGILPIADGVADGTTGLVGTAGVNNFRVFAIGGGPDIRTTITNAALITANTLRIPEMQIDYTIHSGLAVSEEGMVFVVSGGTPAGIGTNPSASFTDIICFEDMCPMDRSADFVDLRGDQLPVPPAPGGGSSTFPGGTPIGDGDSDFYDHLYYRAPIDGVTVTPTGLAGLALGHLRYTNRLAVRGVGTIFAPGTATATETNAGGSTTPTTTGLQLGAIGGRRVLANDQFAGAILFEDLDPGHQVAGGDDQHPPFRGDDSNGLGTPTLAGVPLGGGFEFVFGPGTTSTSAITVTGLPTTGAAIDINPPPTCLGCGLLDFVRLTNGCVWNGFFLNSNGHVTFGSGDFFGSDADPITVPRFRSGARRIAPAAADLNPGSRDYNGNVCTFPVQALGYANINAFKIRWINVPLEGDEACVGAQANGGRTNTFSVTLYDDGTSDGFQDNIRLLDADFDGDLDEVRFPQDDDENNVWPLCSNSLVAGDIDGDGDADVFVDPSNATATCAVGNNLQPYDQQEGPTDLRFTRVDFTDPAGQSRIVGCPPRLNGTGHFIFEYCRMDLLGTAEDPVIVGYSVGNQSPLLTGDASNPAVGTGLCEVGLTGLGGAALAADGATRFTPAVAGSTPVFAGQIGIIQQCLIGEGTEPTIYELFNEGKRGSISTGGVVSASFADFDLRFEGNGFCSPTRQDDANRGKLGFFGVGCEPPQIGICTLTGVTGQGTGVSTNGGLFPVGFTGTDVIPNAGIVPGNFAVTTTGGVSNGATDLVDALCAVNLNIVGCGFFPNEVTTICQGFTGETGVPVVGPGKTVSTSARIACDTNGDGIVEATVILSNAVPVSRNLITATLPTTAITVGNTTSGQSSTAFPLACCGGDALLTVTQSFTVGRNNIFGAFSRTAVCEFPIGTRAPVVISVTPSDANCAVGQDLIITGACFLAPGNVTSVFAIQEGTGTRIDSLRFVVVNNNTIDAFFNFGTGTAGASRRFFIFVQGPGGISRNVGAPNQAAPTGTPANCPLGNELGIPVTVTCNATGTTTPPGGGANVAVVNGCNLNRSASGVYTLRVTGSNIKQGATVTIGGISPKKIKFQDTEAGGQSFSRVTLKGKVCSALPGSIVITNPGAAASAAFNCTEKCATN